MITTNKSDAVKFKVSNLASLVTLTSVAEDWGSLHRKLNLQQGAASMHLTVLRRAGIVATQKEGAHLRYRVNTDRLEELNHLVASFIKK